MKFDCDDINEIRNIVHQEISMSKEFKELSTLIHKRRHYTKLTGHIKVSSERLCECGEQLIFVGSKKSGG